jgi:hypothetical protein
MCEKMFGKMRGYADVRICKWNQCSRVLMGTQAIFGAFG